MSRKASFEWGDSDDEVDIIINHNNIKTKPSTTHTSTIHPTIHPTIQAMFNSEKKRRQNLHPNVKALFMNAEEKMQKLDKKNKMLNKYLLPKHSPLNTLPSNPHLTLHNNSPIQSPCNTSISPLISHLQTSIHSEISWENLKNQKNIRKLEAKATNICGDFFYKSCTNINCNRIHTKDQMKMRFFLSNNKFKTQHCIHNTACKHYMCNFIHSPDVYLLTNNNTPLLTVPNSTFQEIMHQWNSDRHTEYLKYNTQNNNNLKLPGPLVRSDSRVVYN